MIEHDPSAARRSFRIAELAADPQAPRWARDCAWMPGTGHCRHRACSAECLFRAQREAEAEQIVRLRRQRRLPHHVRGRTAVPRLTPR